MDFATEQAASWDWLVSHWGITRPLRHAEELLVVIDRRRKKMVELKLAPWSANCSPRQAVVTLRQN
jgi:hypothetical protein